MSPSNRGQVRDAVFASSLLGFAAVGVAASAVMHVVRRVLPNRRPPVASADADGVPDPDDLLKEIGRQKRIAAYKAVTDLLDICRHVMVNPNHELLDTMTVALAKAGEAESKRVRALELFRSIEVVPAAAPDQPPATNGAAAQPAGGPS
jgi:hypothetical protein